LVPLYHPALRGFRDLSEHLIVKFPQQVNSRARHRQSPLVAALYKKHFRVAELLLEHDADANVCDHKERVLLHAVSTEGNVEVGKWPLDHGADANAHQDDPRTPLHLAVATGHVEATRILRQQNADVNSRDNDRDNKCRSTFHQASNTYSDRGQLIRLAVRLFPEHGIDVNPRDEGWSPLHRPSYRGTTEDLPLLLGNGVRAGVENNKRVSRRRIYCQKNVVPSEKNL